MGTRQILGKWGYHDGLHCLNVIKATSLISSCLREIIMKKLVSSCLSSELPRCAERLVRSRMTLIFYILFISGEKKSSYQLPELEYLAVMAEGHIQ